MMASIVSGRNQQRVIFGKWFGAAPKLLLLDKAHPRRRCQAKQKYTILSTRREPGTAVTVRHLSARNCSPSEQIISLRKGR